MMVPMSLLDRLQSPEDLRQIPLVELPSLCAEIREFLLASLNISGGHFSANLGTVELTVALHYVFNTPDDQLIWDVGHQAYVHKLLTGRRDKLSTIRQTGGLAPFPTREESPYDVFGVGHSSTALSAASGLKIALKKDGLSNEVVAIVGDGALTAGMAYEALCHVGREQLEVKIILNDNAVSISYFKNENIFAPDFFKALNIDYLGPLDGHDLPALILAMKQLKEKQGPVVLHVLTQKGKGYAPAEADPVKFHGVNPGYLTNPSKGPHQTFSQLFGEWICAMAAHDPRLMAITPAMAEGSGLVKFAAQFPDRFFDVGIAEQHAVTLAAGLAVGHYHPVVAIYSTFLQRAYDQVIHDIALQQLPVLFAIDRAGIVGGDGATHQGLFDISFLRCIPNVCIMTPSDENECWHLLNTGFMAKQPAFVRYPRGVGPEVPVIKNFDVYSIGKANLRRQGSRVAILVFGTLLKTALAAAEILDATVVDMRFIKPLDEDMLFTMVRTHELLITLEDNVIAGGAGSACNELLAQHGLKKTILNLGFPDQFIPHGQPEILLAQAGLSVERILYLARS